MTSLAQTVKDRDSDVRWKTVEGIVTLAQASPELARALMPSLVQAIKKKDFHVRNTAAEVIVTLA